MMNQTTLHPFWVKCENNAWCSLRQVDLRHNYYDNLVGVYIIWYWDNLGNPITVKIGQGNIKNRITAHRRDPQIQAYAHMNLLVTWTSIPSYLLDGVEAYLGKVLKPRVGSLFPNAKSIPVGLPFLVNPPWNKPDRQARPY